MHVMSIAIHIIWDWRHFWCCHYICKSLMHLHTYLALHIYHKGLCSKAMKLLYHQNSNVCMFILHPLSFTYGQGRCVSSVFQTGKAIFILMGKIIIIIEPYQSKYLKPFIRIDVLKRHLSRCKCFDIAILHNKRALLHSNKWNKSFEISELGSWLI